MRAVVTGTGYHLPEQVATNADIEKLVADRNDGFQLPAGLIDGFGVKTRRVAPEDAASSDLAALAGLKALENAGVHPMAVDTLIAAGTTFDMAEPATSSPIQDKIGCKNAGVMDVKNSTTSFLNGLDVATSLIESGRAEHVLVTAGEAISALVDWRIKSQEDLEIKTEGLTYGDGAVAFLLSATGDDSRGVLRGEFVTDGSNWKRAAVFAGGTLLRQKADGIFYHVHHTEVAEYVVENATRLAEKVLEEQGWSVEDLTLVAPQQMSSAVTERIRERLGVPADKLITTLEDYGNTVAVGIPLGIALAAEQGRLAKGDKVLLVGGGTGFSAGALPIVW